MVNYFDAILQDDQGVRRFSKTTVFFSNTLLYERKYSWISICLFFMRFKDRLQWWNHIAEVFLSSLPGMRWRVLPFGCLFLPISLCDSERDECVHAPAQSNTILGSPYGHVIRSSLLTIPIYAPSILAKTASASKHSLRLRLILSVEHKPQSISYRVTNLASRGTPIWCIKRLS